VPREMTMDSNRWTQIQSLFHEAADLPKEDQRNYLVSACGSDDILMADVLALLEEDARSSSLLDSDVSHVAHQILNDNSAPPATFREFGHYKIKRVLGEGGMGVVYLAEREDLGSLVAIKILRDAWLSPARRERFAVEQRTLAQLNHPSIARLYDAGILADGTPWFVMEYVDGLPLTEYCRQRKCSIDQRLRLFHAVCEAVLYAHQNAVIHRDLKPSNILVKSDGSVCLLDFGIAKQIDGAGASADQTRTAMRMMTPAYASPEQIRGERVGIQTDVYSLGVILYELLAERLPFDLSNKTPAEAETLIAQTEPQRPSARGKENAERQTSSTAWADLDVICLTALHKDPQRRYRSVEALIRDVDHYLRAEPLEARPDTFRYRMGKFVKRNSRSVTATALAFAAVVALVIFFVLRLTRERDNADRQTAIADSINQFLSNDLLGRSNPLQSGKASETLVDAVVQASANIDRQFQREPQVAARLHQTIARSLDSRTDYPVARREYDRAAALFNQIDGPLSQDAVIVQLQRASMEARTYEAGSLPAAKKILSDQEALLTKIARPRDDLNVWLLSARGMIALIGNDAKSAVQNFQAAIDAAQKLPAFDQRTRLDLKQRLVFAYVRSGDPAKAEQLARELIAEYSTVAGPESPNVLRVRLNLTQALMNESKFAEAVQEANKIYPAFVLMLGEDHELTMQLLATRAQSEGSLGNWDDTIRDDLTIYRIASQKQGPLSFFPIATLSDVSMAQCRAGRLAEGVANARKAVEDSQKAFGDRAGLSDGVRFGLADCLIDLGKLDEASALLQKVDAKAVTQLSGDPNWNANLDLALGEIAFRRGDFVAARKYAQSATPVFSRPDAEPYQKHALEVLTAAIEKRPAGVN
jgi:eukaryotic-like serine/threonine-protein kinase